MKDDNDDGDDVVNVEYATMKSNSNKKGIFNGWTVNTLKPMLTLRSVVGLIALHVKKKSIANYMEQ